MDTRDRPRNCAICTHACRNSSFDLSSNLDLESRYKGIVKSIDNDCDWSLRGHFICKKCSSLLHELIILEKKYESVKEGLRLRFSNLFLPVNDEVENEKNSSSSANSKSKNSLELLTPKSSFSPLQKMKSNDSTEYTCSLCSSFSSPNKRELCLHIRSSHKHYGCRISYCPQIFSNVIKLTRHYKYKHFGSVSSKNFSCEFCSKAFRTHVQLANHDKVHFGKKYSCVLCPKSYISENQLALHIKSHNNIKDAKCSFCSKGFISKAQLASHVKIHGDEREKGHFCDLCSKGFFSSAALTAHSSTHVLIKNFSCVYCGKSFSSSKLLLQHESTHENSNKKYICSVGDCDKKFRTKNGLSLHERCHSGDRPYICHHCGHRFRNPSNLYSHIKSNHSLSSVMDESYLNTSFASASEKREIETLETRPMYFCNF